MVAAVEHEKREFERAQVRVEKDKKALKATLDRVSTVWMMKIANKITDTK